MTDEMIQQLKQVVELAHRQLQDLSRYADSARDECNECTDAYADGIEAACEPFEDFVDDIAKILKQHDIDVVLNAKHVVSERQLVLIDSEGE